MTSTSTLTVVLSTISQNGSSTQRSTSIGGFQLRSWPMRSVAVGIFSARSHFRILLFSELCDEATQWNLPDRGKNQRNDGRA